MSTLIIAAPSLERPAARSSRNLNLDALRGIAILLVLGRHLALLPALDKDWLGGRGSLPGDTLIVAFDSHFLGFWHAGYSLPQFLTAEYPELALPDGTRVFAMHGRDTSLLPSLPAVTSERFVFYPLPQGDPSYQKYLEGVESRLPSGAIRVVHAEGVEFVTGSVSCLSRLFPQTASAVSGEQCVSGAPVEVRPVNNRAHSDGR